LVGAGRRVRPRAAGCDTLSRTLARYLKTGPMPQTVCTPEAHLVTVAAKEDRNPPVAVTRILRRQLRHPSQRWRILRLLCRAIAQRRPPDTKQRASPPLRQTFARRVRYCDTASRHAHHFFAVISFITSISRSRSATSFFSRAFSASSCFRRRTSLAWNVPKRFLHV